ncbi:peptidase family C78-domain-containing protein [Desarmillaria tabescens]|uniref:Peptidase family C78-domain-containing protein n=1 Tax=Armillaria tabescens TaxID=1929756 RepID=A0AA39JST8_ARMTA|nr:peptidase family C78-domain-containing protein [Desarmillaria tabescens]KAK0448281.1 peptidase family C78-domain-containing protein [Desarmillaria tabescens]
MTSKHGAESESGPSASRSATSSRKHHRSKHDSVNREGHAAAETDSFWYQSLQTPPPSNFTPGMILLLKKALLNSHSRGKTRRAVLCFDRAVYVSGQSWDAGWGCGYRNFLMSCSSLMDQHLQSMYFPLLDSPISPSVRQLQLWLEVAWSSGFDVQGAEQLSPLVGSNKWIGVSDLYTAFSSRGIPCELVDFNYKQSFHGNDALIQWIIDYFSPPTEIHRPTNLTEALMNPSVKCTEKMPIILQDGWHSRTVVGYERISDSKVNLLVFDPSRRPRSKIRKAALDINDAASARVEDELLHDALKHFRYRLFNNVFGKQWQILYFPMTEPLTESQMERRKVVVSTRA